MIRVRKMAYGKREEGDLREGASLFLAASGEAMADLLEFPRPITLSERERVCAC